MMDISCDKIKNQIDAKNINKISSYFIERAEAIGTEFNVSIKLSNSFKSLIVAWLYKNWRLARNNIYLINEFEADLEKMIIAEIQLHKEVNSKNKKYWLIDEIEFKE
ncbi:MAG TPA: hypothetical protein DD434_08940 [Bacteroidales bacterium]|jgi:CYTH domain-containing protein|uniref:hypothetical protein n=1 Tax=Clostridium sp. TaxID=1506 RepID=UPI000E8CF3EE|nr:hypothetical protein [Bacteroidales bacterium]